MVDKCVRFVTRDMPINCTVVVATVLGKSFARVVSSTLLNEIIYMQALGNNS